MKTFIKKVLPPRFITAIRLLRGKGLIHNPTNCRGLNFATHWEESPPSSGQKESDIEKLFTDNPLWEYFNAHEQGPGIWKWEHYFPVYHRHFSKFINKKVKILEIGIYSGGSLDMWKSYFGNDCHIFGVDIEEACRVYESENVSVFIGDQEDPNFWDEFSSQVPEIDILIDDGGHTSNQQMVTLEKMLPHISPGGVYVCEDVHGANNEFSDFAAGLVRALNFQDPKLQDPKYISPFQAQVNSIHFYPYAVVIEKREKVLDSLHSPKKGTQWQPFVFK